MKVRLMAEGQECAVEQVGVFLPKLAEVDTLGVGEVGLVIAGIKRVSDAKIGDTITEAARPTARRISARSFSDDGTTHRPGAL